MQICSVFASVWLPFGGSFSFLMPRLIVTFGSPSMLVALVNFACRGDQEETEQSISLFQQFPLSPPGSAFDSPLCFPRSVNGLTFKMLFGKPKRCRKCLNSIKTVIKICSEFLILSDGQPISRATSVMVSPGCVPPVQTNGMCPSEGVGAMVGYWVFKSPLPKRQGRLNLKGKHIGATLRFCTEGELA